MRAARILGVAPWELLKQPIYWTDRALLMDSAEKEAVKAAMPKKREG